ncbi:hypothetical protein WA026_022285 [Henosepilachna vigintioctopunctata]|uniref:Uncharacterized protein n=1 Tax=Henosepilachna vigintioctopunctata TaxID=420089 RepID=A0AAW1VC89_9CUCU
MSTPKMSVIELNHDHKELLGYEIPYKDLGYQNLLENIPDVLKVNGNLLTAGVSLIASEKIAHVNNLVVKQKTGKRQGVDSKRRGKSYHQV